MSDVYMMFAHVYCLLRVQSLSRLIFTVARIQSCVGQVPWRPNTGKAFLQLVDLFVL